MGNQRDEISFRPLEFTFCIMQFSRISQALHVKNLRLFRIKISFNIYCVRSVDEAYCECLYLLKYVVHLDHWPRTVHVKIEFHLKRKSESYFIETLHRRVM